MTIEGAGSGGPHFDARSALLTVHLGNMVSELEDKFGLVFQGVELMGGEIVGGIHGPLFSGGGVGGGEGNLSVFVADALTPGKTVSLFGPVHGASVEEVAEGDDGLDEQVGREEGDDFSLFEGGMDDGGDL